MTTDLAPILSVISGRATVSSLDVARHFGKRHDHVLRDIRNLRRQLPPERLPNFGDTPYVDPQNGRSYPAYAITRTGFTLLAIGFTGHRALQFKLAYIDAFDAMEASLSRPAVRPRLPYMAEPWFVLLHRESERMLRCACARCIGVSPATLSQVLNGSGKYGAGTASTAAVAQRVLHVFRPARPTRPARSLVTVH